MKDQVKFWLSKNSDKSLAESKIQWIIAAYPIRVQWGKFFTVNPVNNASNLQYKQLSQVLA
jgi:hypothetical protein